jgi:hypothetical protein
VRPDPILSTRRLTPKAGKDTPALLKRNYRPAPGLNVLQRTLQTIHTVADMYSAMRSFSKSRRLRMAALSFPDHLEGILVVFQSNELGVPRVVGPGQLQQLDLRDYLRPQPNTVLHLLRS